MAQGESKLSRKIITALEVRGVFCFKVHGGPHMMSGLPDIIACVEGQFWGFETKMPDGKDATPIQKFIHTKIRSAGGQAHVVRSVVEVLQILGLE